MPNDIYIESPNRIHITLIAMDNPVYRVNGGIGFAIDCKNLLIKASKDKNIAVFDERTNSLSMDEVLKLQGKLNEVRNNFNLPGGLHVTILSGPDSHHGFGSGTALTLSSIEAYLQLYNIHVSNSELINMSGRGGTSGIGVNTYFHGGYVLDCGHEYIGQNHGSSRDNECRQTIPLTIIRHPMPDWEFGIFIPSNINAISGEKESEFFINTCPISKSDVGDVLYHSILGTTCSIIESNLEMFCTSINKIQNTAWKSAEINIRDCQITDIMNTLSSNVEMIGMSSLGPLLFFVTNKWNEINEALDRDLPPGELLKARPNNIGRLIKHD